VLSTFAVLTNAGEPGALLSSLGQIFTPLTAFSFLCFTLLYMPCIAAFSATKREMSSMKNAALTMGYQTAVAWVVAFVVFQTGSLLGF
jgi:ferrous iron transport protein B